MFDLLLMTSCDMKMTSGNVKNTNIRDTKETAARICEMSSQSCFPECM